jgi:hypothetical protein
MARNLGDIEEAIESGSGVQTATLRSSISSWGIVLPTRSRAERATEAVSNLEARANYARELQARGGRWRYSARRIALEILALIDIYDEWFIDYELTPQSDDSSGAIYGIPFGEWADADSRIGVDSITAIAEQEIDGS